MCGKSWVSNFWDPPILYLGCQTFCIKRASNPRHFAGKFPKRSATVPLDRRDGDDEVTRFWWSRTSQTDTRSRFNVLRYVTLTVVNLTDTSQCIQPLYSLQQVPNLLLHYRGGSGGSLPPAPPPRYVSLLWWISLTLVNVFSLFTHCNKYRIYFYIIEGGPGGASPRHHLLRYVSLTVVNLTDTS